MSASPEITDAELLCGKKTAEGESGKSWISGR
jgi:hypothetical protein